ncbi:hypothetical protein [Amycolatopsis sp. 195334CR]|uniref:hypothetical protein n=1 Tax=Amycolatopsis sp. 195334CR TaxID=2814588 RepID=UPI001A8FDF69|nr:hypothetical protein [Amycolatopsis sp. 195334CR]MBN6034130.1 hypothetical protein [Amycolatopsis sp. 195334CR]
MRLLRIVRHLLDAAVCLLHVLFVAAVIGESWRIESDDYLVYGALSVTYWMGVRPLLSYEPRWRGYELGDVHDDLLKLVTAIPFDYPVVDPVDDVVLVRRGDSNGVVALVRIRREDYLSPSADHTSVVTEVFHLLARPAVVVYSHEPWSVALDDCGLPVAAQPSHRPDHVDDPATLRELLDSGALFADRDDARVLVCQITRALLRDDLQRQPPANTVSDLQ